MDPEHENQVNEVAIDNVDVLKSEVALHEAARTNNVDVVRSLLVNKIDVNCKNSVERTALHWAAANGHRDVMSVLLRSNADYEICDKYGMRPIHWAAWFGHREAVEQLVRAGAGTRNVNKQGQNILHCSALNNQLDVVSYICDTLDSFPLNEKEKVSGRTALHLAASAGHADVVEKLCSLTEIVKPAVTNGKNKTTRKGEVIEIFTPKCQILADDSGETAVHLAAENGYEDVMQKLMKCGVKLDDVDKEGRSALHFAAGKGHASVVEMLLAAGLNANAVTDKGESALHLACAQGHASVADVLLKQNCNADAQNKTGNTALHVSAENNHLQCVRSLLESPCQLNVVNQRHQTALHLAVEGGHMDIVEMLLIAGANVDVKEKSGKTAIMLASRNNMTGIVDMIVKFDLYQLRQRDDAHSGTGSVAADVMDIQFKNCLHPATEFMKPVLWKLATKQLKAGEWKTLAKSWGFTDDHFVAIEHQYTDEHSYREHGYRALLIWMHGVKDEENPVKLLYEALVAIGKKDLAEKVRRKCTEQAQSQPGSCRMS